MTVTEKRKGQTSIESFFGKKAKIVKEEMENTTAVSSIVEVKGGVKEEVKLGESVRTENGVVVAVMGKENFKGSCSEMLIRLLDLELNTIEDSWFQCLSEEFRKPYFIKLKNFIDEDQKKNKIFPPPNDIYSWSRLTPFKEVKVVIIGQDPYHNHNQAHGLAFSVKSPTPAPPSLKNIYKELKNDYPDFEIDNKTGDLTPWSKQGVLLLNTALTVRAHNANSHSKIGWLSFTKAVVESLVNDRIKTKEPIVFLLWGNNAIKLVENILIDSKHINKNNLPSNFKLFKSVHPSPLSASRGFFGNHHFKQINEWLYEQNADMIDWSVVPGSSLEGIKKH